jgi:hypothetical protein
MLLINCFENRADLLKMFKYSSTKQDIANLGASEMGLEIRLFVIHSKAKSAASVQGKPVLI